MNSLDDCIESAISKFAHNTRLGGGIYVPGGRAIVHRRLDSLEDWDNKKIAQINVNPTHGTEHSQAAVQAGVWLTGEELSSKVKKKKTQTTLTTSSMCTVHSYWAVS